MKQKRKTISQNNWLYLIPQLSIFLLFALFLREIDISRYWLLSLSMYLLLNGYLKVIIPNSHRKGLYYVRKGEFEGAIHIFGKSYKFFTKYLWVDKYRAFTLLSLSKLSYREMALMNIIYCYQMLGNEKEDRNYQKKLAAEFPNNIYGVN